MWHTIQFGVIGGDTCLKYDKSTWYVPPLGLNLTQLHDHSTLVFEMYRSIFDSGHTLAVF